MRVALAAGREDMQGVRTELGKYRGRQRNIRLTVIRSLSGRSCDGEGERIAGKRPSL